MQTYKIHSEFVGAVSEECFDVLYKGATDHAHSFLYIEKREKGSEICNWEKGRLSFRTEY